MNQILSETTSKKRTKTSVHSNIVVFTIILIIFGLGMTTTGVYSYYKSISNRSNDSLAVETSKKPVITLEIENANTINIVVSHDKGIANVTYTINDEEPVEINGNNNLEVKQKVTLPVGTSNITITAKDINGVSSSYHSSYNVEQKPVITLEQVESKIQATIESEINISYVTYYWDDDEQNAKQYEVNDVKNVTLIDALEGMHTLNIKAVDVEGNEATKSQKVKGDNKPEVKVTSDKKNFIIKASDDESITKVEIKLNSNDTITEEVNSKEYTKNIALENGENKLIVVVYNKNGLSTTARVKYTKE